MYMYICYVQSTDSEVLCYNPRIVHANLGSNNLLRKPRIRTQSSKIRNQTSRVSTATNSRSITHACCLQSRNACSIDRGFVATDDRAGLLGRSTVGLVAVDDQQALVVRS